MKRSHLIQPGPFLYRLANRHAFRIPFEVERSARTRRAMAIGREHTNRLKCKIFRCDPIASSGKTNSPDRVRIPPGFRPYPRVGPRSLAQPLAHCRNAVGVRSQFGVEDRNDDATRPTSPTHPHPGGMRANACCDPLCALCGEPPQRQWPEKDSHEATKGRALRIGVRGGNERGRRGRWHGPGTVSGRRTPWP